MADSLNTSTTSETEELTLLDAGDVLADARHFVLCAEMAVANFGCNQQVSAVQSATMAAIEKIQRVEDFLMGTYRCIAHHHLLYVIVLTRI